MIPLQLFAILVGLGAIHLTYLYYKRSHFTKIEVILWFIIWLGFIFVTIFPNSVRPIVGYLGLQRSMDFIMIVAFVILFLLSFHNYIINHRQRQRLEYLIRELAIKDID